MRGGIDDQVAQLAARPSAPALTETLSRWPIETAWPSETISASMSRTSRSNSTGSTAFSSAKSYGDAARIARTLYRSGETSLLDVLDTERSLYSAEDDLLQSRVAIATDYIALNKALGGGWDARSIPRSPRTSTSRPVPGWRRSL
jgi:hypothetical protein